MYSIAGRPGAGKSVATGVASSLRYEVVAMGDVVRNRARDALGPEVSSEAIGQWAAEQRAEDGPGVVAEYTADRIEEIDSDVETVVDGIRTPAEAEVFEQHFGKVSVVLITAPFETRLERLQERGRDGEDEFSATDLRARDAREVEWGLAELDADEVIVNDESLEEFEEQVVAVLS